MRRLKEDGEQIGEKSLSNKKGEWTQHERRLKNKVELEEDGGGK
jgi:hypothetical protein